jgi:hypothetical protein
LFLPSIILFSHNCAHLFIFRDAVSKNNVDTVNTNIYLCIRNDASSPVIFGLAYLSGACASKVAIKSAIQEWDMSDLETAKVNFMSFFFLTVKVAEAALDPLTSG